MDITLFTNSNIARCCPPEVALPQLPGDDTEWQDSEFDAKNYTLQTTQFDIHRPALPEQGTFGIFAAKVVARCLLLHIIQWKESLNPASTIPISQEEGYDQLTLYINRWRSDVDRLLSRKCQNLANSKLNIPGAYAEA